MSTSTTATRSRKVLSPEALQVLRGHDQDITISNGFRLISNSSYISNSSIDSQATVLIPDELESLETVKFLQFTDETANLIFEQYLNDLEQNPDRAHLMSTVRSYVGSIAGNATDVDGDDAWVSLFQRIGMTRLFQRNVMDPDFGDMRAMGSLKEWVLEAAAMRFEFLRSLSHIITTPARGVKKQVSHMSLDGKLAPGPYPTIPTRSSSLKGPAVGNFNAPAPGTKPQEPSTRIEGYKTFYKGSTLPRLEAIFIQNGNAVNFNNVLSSPPGNFSRLIGGLYLTKHEQVAWRYAQWAKKIVDGNVVPIGIMTVAIPDELLSSMAEVVGDDWRRFVWINRRGDELMPEELNYLQEYQWLVGSICAISNDRVVDMEDISELEAWRLNGEAVQQVWTGDNYMLNLLNQKCVGKVWVRGMAYEDDKN